MNDTERRQPIRFSRIVSTPGGAVIVRMLASQ
jgi:hypothetical protein